MANVENFLRHHTVVQRNTYALTSDLYAAYVSAYPDDPVGRTAFLRLVEKLMDYEPAVQRQSAWSAFTGLRLIENGEAPCNPVRQVDTVAEFGAAHLREAEDLRTSASSLYAAYRGWCLSRRDDPVPPRAFKETINAPYDPERSEFIGVAFK